MPPAAADATLNTTARPHFDPHGNGVRIGEADVPAPSAGTGDDGVPTPPTAPARPLDPVLVQLLSRLVGHVFGDITVDERLALDAFCRDWRPAMAMAPVPAPPPTPTPSPARAPAPSSAALAPAPAPAYGALDNAEWRPVRQVQPAYGVFNADGSLPTAHADGSALGSIEWHSQFNAPWYWTDGAAVTLQ